LRRFIDTKATPAKRIANAPPDANPMYNLVKLRLSSFFWKLPPWLMPPDTKKPSVALGVKVGIELGFWDVVGVFEGAADGDSVHVLDSELGKQKLRSG